MEDCGAASRQKDHVQIDKLERFVSKCLLKGQAGSETIGHRLIQIPGDIIRVCRKFWEIVSWRYVDMSNYPEIKDNAGILRRSVRRRCVPSKRAPYK